MNVYVFADHQRQLVKIGLTNLRARDRMSSLCSNAVTAGFRIKLACVLFCEGGNEHVEQRVHRMLRAHRHVGEWFSCSPSTAVEAVADAMHWWHTQGIFTSDRATWYRGSIMTSAVTDARRDQAARLRKDGWTQRRIAKKLGVSQPAVFKLLRGRKVG